MLVEVFALVPEVARREKGTNRAEKLLESGDLYAPANLQRLTELNLALHAYALMRRDVDYIVCNDRVEIADAFTGRVVEDRRWPDGLQAAIKTKEGVRPSQHRRVLGQVTLQTGRPIVEGLIEYEWRRSPDSDPLQLLKNAIYPLERDRR
jgi:preprotein translocase subunit SecA